MSGQLPSRKQVGDQHIAADAFNALVETVEASRPRAGGNGRLNQTPGGATVDAPRNRRNVQRPVIHRARITAVAPGNKRYRGFRIDERGHDINPGELLTIYTNRIPGESGTDDLREMAPLPPMTGQSPPPDDDWLFVTQMGFDDEGNTGEAWWATTAFIGTCPATGEGDAPRGTTPIIRAAVAEMLGLLRLVGFDGDKLDEAERLLPSCCGRADGV